MDEPVWDSVKTYTNFRHNKTAGGQVAGVQTFFLKDIITPDALRLEFHRDLIEPYEIEVFTV